MWRHATNKKGFTLIELMVSMVILSIGLMAMLDGLGNYIRLNIENSMRNEAMRIAETSLETLRNARFAEIQSYSVTNLPSPSNVQRRFRNIDTVYTVTWQRQPVSTSSYAIQVHVVWAHRGINHSHDAATIISTES